SVEGDVYNGSNEYDITLLEDRPPTVTFEKPGRDTRATSIEEVFTQAKAEDDYGVLSLDLYFAVNGGEGEKGDLQKLKGGSARDDGRARLLPRRIRVAARRPDLLLRQGPRRSQRNNQRYLLHRGQAVREGVQTIATERRTGRRRTAGGADQTPERDHRRDLPR